MVYTKTHREIYRQLQELISHQYSYKIARFKLADAICAKEYFAEYKAKELPADKAHLINIQDVTNFIGLVASGFTSSDVETYFKTNNQLIFDVGHKAIYALSLIGSKKRGYINNGVYARMLSAVFHLWVLDFHQLKNKLKAVWELPLPDELSDGSIPKTWARLFVKYGCHEYFRATLADFTSRSDIFDEGY